MKMDYDTYMKNRRPGSTAAGSDGSLLNTSRYGLEVKVPVNLHRHEPMWFRNECGYFTVRTIIELQWMFGLLISTDLHF